MTTTENSKVEHLHTSSGNNTDHELSIPNNSVDRRVRIRPKSKDAWKIFFGTINDENIIWPLHPMAGGPNGVVFPYSPTINYSHNAEWSPYTLTHTNYQQESFARSYPSEISIVGQFSAQNYQEAVYALASIHFFRTVTKMFYGKNDPLRGTPPPTLLLSGHGQGIFNDIPVVVKTFTFEMLPDVDYVEVPYNRGRGSAWLPSLFNIFVTVSVQPNLVKIRDEFKLSEFGSGKLLSKKGYI